MLLVTFGETKVTPPGGPTNNASRRGSPLLPPAPGAVAAHEPQAYANLAQLMQAIPFPASNIIFDTQTTDPGVTVEPGDTAGAGAWTLAGASENARGWALPIAGSRQTRRHALERQLRIGLAPESGICAW